MIREYILYTAFKCAIAITGLVPVEGLLFLARLFGRLYYYLAGRKNRKAYANLKIAFRDMSGRERKRIIKAMYIRFAQNLVEAIKLPSMDEAYIRKHVRIADLSAIDEAKKDKRCIVFLGSHSGSWELSNAACAALFPDGSYAMLAQPQARHKKLDDYLNGLRRQKGIRVIRVDELKALIQHMTAGNVIGTIADHGGQDGIPVDFFGKLAMTPVGGVRLAKKMGSRIILAFMRRVSGPYHELLLEPYELVLSGDSAEDMRVNLTNINRVFEGWISRYPQEYLWFYKRWKHSPQKDALVLSDGKTGHLKQSLACMDILADIGLTVRSHVAEIGYKSWLAAKVFIMMSRLFGRRLAFWILPLCVKPEKYREIISGAYDIVISAGSSLAALNGALAFENSARSIVVMKPGIEPLSRFDMAIIPRHDLPARKKNIVAITGSLNAVTRSSIKDDFCKLVSSKPELKKFDGAGMHRIGLLIGGNSRTYTMTAEMIGFLSSQVRRFLDERNGVIFLTTSRRTPESVVDALAADFIGYAACGLFVSARESNPPGTVGGIFYLSNCIIVSGESISMVSEAAASGRHVIVFEPHCSIKDNKVKRFLNSLAGERVIHLVKLNEIYDKMMFLFEHNPEIKSIETRTAVLEGLKKII